VVSVKFAMSEKKIVSFFRLAATLVVCVPVKIELYDWGIWYAISRRIGAGLVAP
jgi:hypothetical protein